LENYINFSLGREKGEGRRGKGEGGRGR